MKLDTKKLSIPDLFKEAVADCSPFQGDFRVNGVSALLLSSFFCRNSGMHSYSNDCTYLLDDSCFDYCHCRCYSG